MMFLEAVIPIWYGCMVQYKSKIPFKILTSIIKVAMQKIMMIGTVIVSTDIVSFRDILCQDPFYGFGKPHKFLPTFLIRDGRHLLYC